VTTQAAHVEPGLVSTIIPVFNRAAMLREAVGSVLAQTHRPIELIIVDDGSTDDTPMLGRALADDHPREVRFVTQANGGPGRAREAGRRQARGEFIQYLDSDDLLHPRKFEVQVAALRARPDCGVAYCYTRHYRVSDAPVDVPWKGSGSTVDAMFPSFLTERWWDTPTPLYRRSVCEAAGPWEPLSLHEDWEYDCRVAALGTRLVHCREFLADVRDHAEARLCRGSAFDAARNRERARAYALIYRHARRAGIGPGDVHMQRFARSLFLLARQCGASGLPGEAAELFELAVAASGPQRVRAIDYRLYRVAATCLGWRAVGHIARLVDLARSSVRAS